MNTTHQQTLITILRRCHCRAATKLGSCRRSGWSNLALFVTALLCLTGCQSSKTPGSSSLAAVLIYGSSASAVREATLAVFQQNEYTHVPSDGTDLVFECVGTTWEAGMYGTFGEGNLWMRVEVKIQPYGDAQLLRCDVFAVRNHGDSFFSETHKIHPLSTGKYKKLLAEVQTKVKIRSK